jgi:hypothetical protein
MFQAGAVAPSSARLLHDDTGPLGLPETDPVFWELFEPPVKAGDIARPYEGIAAEAEVFVGLFDRPYALCLIDPDPFDDIDPIPDGVSGVPCFLGPIVDLNVDGLTACACREKAPIHCRTCAGSFPSNRSTVKKRSCDCMFSGGISHAFKN